MPDAASHFEDDPVYRHARREAFFILGLWTSCFFYTIGYCYLNGYLTHEPDPTATGPAISELVGPLESFNRDPESLSEPFGLGIPDWVFYGIVVPWLVCIVATFWFCFFLYVEDDLNDDDADRTDEEGTA